MQNKKILFIAPSFFSVEKIIIDELKKEGNIVYECDERVVQNSFLKAVNIICPYAFYGISNRYYKKAIKNIPVDIDYILVIKGETISKKTLLLLRNVFYKARIILYLYDSVKNVRGIASKIDLYDKVYSFDSEDCKKYGYIFRPLFCDNKNVLSTNNNKTEFDLCFYGTMYSDRFAIINAVDSICKKQKKSFYKFCYLAGDFMKSYYFLTNSGYRHFKKSAISTIPKSHHELASIIDSSFAVLDINDPNQSGLTIRTFEALFSGKRIITTNEKVAEYSFYDPKYILIINRKKIVIPSNFFENNNEKVKYANLEKYTAKGWIKDVFDENQK